MEVAERYKKCSFIQAYDGTIQQIIFCVLALEKLCHCVEKKVNKIQITLIYVEKVVTSLIQSYFYYCYICKSFFLKLNKLGTCVHNLYSVPTTMFMSISTTLFYVDFLYLMDHYYHRHVPPWEGHKCKAQYAKEDRNRFVIAP